MKSLIYLISSIIIVVAVIHCDTNGETGKTPEVEGIKTETDPKIKGNVDFFIDLPYNVTSIVMQQKSLYSNEFELIPVPADTDYEGPGQKFSPVINKLKPVSKNAISSEAGVAQIPENDYELNFKARLFVDTTGQNRLDGEGVIEIYCFEHIKTVGPFDFSTELPGRSFKVKRSELGKQINCIKTPKQ